MSAQLLSGSVWGVLLVLWLAVEEIAPVKRCVRSAGMLVLGAAVRVGLID